MTAAADATRDTFPADLQAQVVHICSELGSAGPMMLAMTFAGRLDATRLARAARLLVDAEPILGCRFEPDARPPVWRRRGDLDQETWCVVHTVDDPDPVIRRLLEPVPAHRDDSLRLHLLRCPDGDRLLMWISHLLADSYAAGECAGALAEIYSRLGADPGYRPEPNPGPYDTETWMTDITFRDVLRIVRRDMVDALQARGPVHGFQRDYEAFRAPRPIEAAVVQHRIPPAVVQAMDRTAAARRCTRNDLLTAGFLRAFAGFAGRGPRAKAQVGLTVNLRSYAPARARPVPASMVGVSQVSIGPDLGASFDATLAQVTAVTRRQKQALMGAANPLFVRLIGLMSFRQKRAMVRMMIRKTMRRPMAPMFSNAGRISAARLRFDGVSPVDAGFVVFPVSLPMFLVGALEYAGAVTLTSCFQRADLAPDRVAELLRQMVQEIPVALAADTPELAREIA